MGTARLRLRQALGLPVDLKMACGGVAFVGRPRGYHCIPLHSGSRLHTSNKSCGKACTLHCLHARTV